MDSLPHYDVETSCLSSIAFISFVVNLDIFLLGLDALFRLTTVQGVFFRIDQCTRNRFKVSWDRILFVLLIRTGRFVRVPDSTGIRELSVVAGFLGITCCSGRFPLGRLADLWCPPSSSEDNKLLSTLWHASSSQLFAVPFSYWNTVSGSSYSADSWNKNDADVVIVAECFERWLIVDSSFQCHCHHYYIYIFCQHRFPPSSSSLSRS